jgi:3-phenylpropionate/trans-cinnamate dioxygenase ferredoxin reductase subunit
MSLRTMVIVGGGLAGAAAAAALRTRGFDGEVVLFGAEDHAPYERPMLSKEYLRGERDAAALQARPDGFYADHAIDVRPGANVSEIRPRERMVLLAGGSMQRYDRLLLATGAAPKSLGVPGEDLAGVHRLRTVDDADAIRKAAATADQIAVIGGGWIGTEVAASLRQLGGNVTLVAPTASPLERVLGPEVAAVYRELHARNGVALSMNSRVRALRGRDRVAAVELADGSSIPADLVVIGVGAAPRVDLAVGTAIAVGDGIETDEFLATNVPDIFAAGDVASALHPFFERRIRVEHWDNAKRQGAAAAASMLGDGEPYGRIPYFYSDQFDLSIEYTGFAPAWDRVVLRGDPRSGGFSAFWLLGGRLIAGLNANVPGSIKAMSALVATRPEVEPDRLADPGIPLDDLVHPSAALVAIGAAS